MMNRDAEYYHIITPPLTYTIFDEYACDSEYDRLSNVCNYIVTSYVMHPT